MSAEKTHWRLHVVLVTIIASVFAAVPFLMGAEIAQFAAMILFPSTIAAYVIVMRLSGVQPQGDKA
jgi:hypothetical protein